MILQLESLYKIVKLAGTDRGTDGKQTRARAQHFDVEPRPSPHVCCQFLSCRSEADEILSMGRSPNIKSSESGDQEAQQQDKVREKIPARADYG